MREVAIDIATASTDALRLECARLGVSVAPDATHLYLQTALRKHQTSYNFYTGWVMWGQLLCIPGLKVDEDTTLPHIVRTVSDFLYARLTNEGYVHEQAQGKPVTDPTDPSDVFYLTGRPAVDCVATVRKEGDWEGVYVCHITFAAGSALADVRPIWMKLLDWRLDN